MAIWMLIVTIEHIYSFHQIGASTQMIAKVCVILPCVYLCHSISLPPSISLPILCVRLYIHISLSLSVFIPVQFYSTLYILLLLLLLPSHINRFLLSSCQNSVVLNICIILMFRLLLCCLCYWKKEIYDYMLCVYVRNPI